ncbi:hypothetical protein EDC04DRAFT_3097017 [Pisolithus marmoratus]|nr:hypothetical protein EDC04DRAFT_3097017 [Pisolithus marmoratus]
MGQAGAERKPSQRNDIFGFVKTSNSTGGLVSGPGGAQETQEKRQAVPYQEVCEVYRIQLRPSSSASVGAQEQTPPVPPKDVEKSTAKPEPPHPPASTGKDIDAAVQGFSGIHTIPRIAQGGIQNLSDTYLRPFKIFKPSGFYPFQLITYVHQIHPYAQAALGILTAAASDKAVSDLLDKVLDVYQFLTEDESINNIDKMRDTLAKIARAMSASAQFINNYSVTKSFWKRTGKNIFSETENVVTGYVKP